MSKKRKLYAIMATRVEDTMELDRDHGDAIAKSARNGQIITIKKDYPTTSWSLHAKLFEKHCKPTWRTENRDTLGAGQSAEAFDLFVQWLYQQRYHETTDLVKALNTISPLYDNHSLSPPSGNSETMHWNVKAAILCWTLGQHLGATDFQNYAMIRLFAAFSQPPTTSLTAKVMKYVTKSVPYSKLEYFLEDLVVRNWGDETVVNQKNQVIWSELLERTTFRGKFVKGTLLSLEKRQKVLLHLKNYLIDAKTDIEA